jgi:hypothetical protein
MFLTGSMASTVTRLWASQSEVRFPAPKRFPPPFFLMFRLTLEHPSLVFSGYMGVHSLEAQQSEHYIDHSHPSSAKFKNEWNYTLIPSVRLINMYGFIFK